MKIAIPIENGHLNSHFGGSRQFAIVEVDPNTKATLRSETLPAPEHQPGVFSRWLQGLGVELVIVGGIGQRALAIFAQHGIKVLAGQPDAPVEALVGAYLAGQMVQAPEACAHHHSEHGHHHHQDQHSPTDVA
jgi:predicted Fe-Mo cluster-binding NifX family protein